MNEVTPKTADGEPYNSSFSIVQPGLQVAWDSTSLGLLKECPRKYYYSIVQGFQPHTLSLHLAFGLYYHHALEAYDHARSAGVDHRAAQRAAVLAALRVSGTRNASGWHPWNSENTYKNRFTLVRTVVWYLEQFEDDPCKTVQLVDGRPAVELSFRYDTGMVFNTGEHAVLCGHLDRVVELGGNYYILDRKTTWHDLTPKFFLGFSPDNQMSNYALAGKVVFGTAVEGILIDGAQIGVGFSRFLRGFTPRTSSQLDEWFGETQYYMRTAELFAQRNHWPMNDKSCGNYGGCPFRGVCSASPEVRDDMIGKQFHRRVWDPLQVRGDI